MIKKYNHLKKHSFILKVVVVNRKLISKHKSENYKIIAVKYYLKNDTNYTKTCKIFKCSKRSLKRLDL